MWYTIGWHFNQSVDNLPNSISHLTFIGGFDQPVNNLPNSISHLTFEYCFDQPVNHLPNSIIHLTFGDNFNQQLERFYELDDEVRFYEKRQASGHPIFDADQKPKLNGKTTRIALSDLYQSTVGNTERSINLSIDYATLLLVRMQLIKNREVLGIPDLNARWKQQTFSDYDKLKDTISHIDVLTGIRQDRLGFLDRKLI